MSWEGSDRGSRLPADWPAIRSRVLKRDGGQCTAWLPKTKKRCPRPATDVDHKVPGDDHSMKNLRSLCAHHHGKKSSQEGRQARAAFKALRYRDPEDHPGQL